MYKEKRRVPRAEPCFEVFDYFGDIVGGYSDFRTGWESGYVILGEFVQRDIAVGRGKVRR